MHRSDQAVAAGSCGEQQPRSPGVRLGGVAEGESKRPKSPVFVGQNGDEVIAAERPHGAFTRQLFVGDTLDAGRLVASYETGVLTLRIPVAESAKPRRVQITEGADERTIEAQTTQTGA